MSSPGQIGSIILMNLRHLPQRLGSSLVVVIGIAGVVGVTVSVLAMAEGLLTTFTSTGRPDRAIVLAMSAFSEAGSSLPRNEVQAIMSDCSTGQVYSLISASGDVMGPYRLERCDATGTYPDPGGNNQKIAYSFEFHPHDDGAGQVFAAWP